MRKILAILCGKLIFLLTRLLNQGGGTAAPGYYALKIDPNILESFYPQFKKGSIVITGTNGKTTTARLISHYFSQKKIKYIHNRAGSNLERGLLSALLEKCSVTGLIQDIDYGLWEIDEAVFSKIVINLNPKIVVLTNLFRDQLDRYGEVDSTRRKWATALSSLSACKVLYNADDSQLVDLVEDLKTNNPKLSFISYGITPDNNISPLSEDILSPVELTLCPRCKTRLTITNETIIGQGKFTCSHCGLTNPILDLTITPKSSQSGLIKINNQEYHFDLPMAGMFNLYNFAAAFSLIAQLSEQNLNEFLLFTKNFTSAFGRGEKISINNKSLLIYLIKNPTGFSEILKTVLLNSDYSSAVFILNDNFADGKDVSWIWDVNLPKYLSPKLATFYTSGSRVYDISLRLKYAQVEQSKIKSSENIEECIAGVLEDPTSGATVPIFTTYTAMLELQKYFEKIGVKKNYLEEAE